MRDAGHKNVSLNLSERTINHVLQQSSPFSRYTRRCVFGGIASRLWGGNVDPPRRSPAGPVDVDTAMKAYAGLSTLQGALDYLSPKTANKLYGLVGADDVMSSFCQSYISGDSAGIAVALYSSVFMNVDGTKACGLALIPAILNQASLLLDGKPQEIGCNVPMQYFHFVFIVFAARAALLGTENAGTILKYYAGYVSFEAS